MSENVTNESVSEALPEDFPMPPVSMEFLVLSLKAQAEMQLGILHFGDDKDAPKPDIRIARHTIDVLALLQDKTRNNLSMDEQRLLENSLTELRFRYVQALESRNKQEAAPPETQWPAQA
jgi:hypothetical protein